ncbi:eCIS core domain-containing protein [Amycolatopsis anabasis]|uniref:eCIS core domain-containing protein n=1 Tax=Amycolatopsis anabasis TaxID=1840409 RepID=UPI00131DE8E7
MHEKEQAESTDRVAASTPVAAEVPPAQARMLELQRTVGNAAVVQRSAVHEALSAPGSPLDDRVRTEMESRLGADFSDVRVHTDDSADRAAASVEAHAFTSGSHIVFQRGRYDTGSHAGKKMLAHELTHVVQQRSGPVSGTDAGDGLKVSDPADTFERAAEENAERVMQRSVQEHTDTRTRAPGTGDGSIQRVGPLKRLGYALGRGSDATLAQAQGQLPTSPLGNFRTVGVNALGNDLQHVLSWDPPGADAGEVLTREHVWWDGDATLAPYLGQEFAEYANQGEHYGMSPVPASSGGNTDTHALLGPLQGAGVFTVQNEITLTLRQAYEYSTDGGATWHEVPGARFTIVRRVRRVGDRIEAKLYKYDQQGRRLGTVTHVF